LGSFKSFENMLTLKFITTLFETQELALVEVNANNELSEITINRVSEYRIAVSFSRTAEKSASTI